MRVLLPLMCLALAACSSEPAEPENADDFAARIGQQDAGSSDQTAASQPAADLPNTAEAAPPQGADVTQLQKLGDVGGVAFGPREGGCTFQGSAGDEMLIAAGMRDRGMPGKAVIRVGNGLVLLDSGPGGLDAIRSGTSFTGEGVTVRVAPAGGEGRTRRANLSVAGADGKTQTYSGNWICA